jgi:SH3-like domain-containing protein
VYTRCKLSQKTHHCYIVFKPVKFRRRLIGYLFPFSLIALVGLIAGCGRGRNGVKEIAYVTAPQAVLRDQVAAVYNTTGTVKNGEAVQVLGRDRRFARVRTSTGVEGWIEQRYLISRETYDAFQKLTEQTRNDPVQATGTAHNQTNIHLQPNRGAEHLYQIDQGAKLSVLKRASSEKALPGAPAKATNVGKDGQSPSPPPLEDWWMIRDEQRHTGWVLARMVDVDIPLEVAQYAEGQRTVAAFVLDQVTDGEKKVPQYLVLFSENKDGMPFDYNQVRVFTWNVRRHRYETAYRERNLNGVLPVTLSQENFEKEGNLPVFVVRVKDDAGNVTERKYKLNTPIVRRVLAPGEEKPVVGRLSPVVRKKKRRPK